MAERASALQVSHSHISHDASDVIPFQRPQVTAVHPIQRLKALVILIKNKLGAHQLEWERRFLLLHFKPS
jgi:hypothetical protein